MRQIWKFPISVVRQNQLIAMPAVSEVIDAQIQNGTLCLWAIVDTTSPAGNVRVDVIGTGWDVPDDVSASDHVATVQDIGFVWHVFLRRDQ
jgi:hypothetical protein